MANLREMAAINAEKSCFIPNENGTIEVQNASILYPDFTGKVTEFHKILGEKRSFNLVLNQEGLETLAAIEKSTGLKFRVHFAPLHSGENINDKDVEKIAYINVKVNMDNDFPPAITLFTTYMDKRTRKTLNKNTVGILDTVDIQSCDLILNVYVSKKLKSEYVSCYLRKLNVIQEPHIEFGGKYDEWDEDNEEEE